MSLLQQATAIMHGGVYSNPHVGLQNGIGTDINACAVIVTCRHNTNKPATARVPFLFCSCSASLFSLGRLSIMPSRCPM